MSILGNLFNRILHHDQPAATTQASPTAAPAATTTAQASPVGSGQAPQPNLQPAAPTASPGAATASVERVDIEQVLDGMASRNPQKLNWRSSIVDLMKLVGMDSSLAERKQLADELGYKGDKGDSAAMNIWLHQQVMRKLEDNGGKVPADLKG